MSLLLMRRTFDGCGALIRECWKLSWLATVWGLELTGGDRCVLEGPRKYRGKEDQVARQAPLSRDEVKLDPMMQSFILVLFRVRFVHKSYRGSCPPYTSSTDPCVKRYRPFRSRRNLYLARIRCGRKQAHFAKNTAPK